MPNNETVVMAEVAYRSFAQMAEGDVSICKHFSAHCLKDPLVIIYPPRARPKTKAAAVSPEGFAYKDYVIQLTQKAFDLMGSEVSKALDTESGPPIKMRKLSDGRAFPTYPPSSPVSTYLAL